MAFEFLEPQKAWDKLVKYRRDYYRQNIAVYTGDRTDLNATSDEGMFWLRKSKCRIHVPVAADIATVSANLLFSEEPSFTCVDEETEDNESKQQNRLDMLVAKNNIHGKLNEAAESCAALGDVYLKLNWWKDEIDYPVLSVVPADAAWPEFLFGILKGIHFFSVVSRDDDSDEVIRVYELYQPGQITMAMYKGSTDQLGQEMGSSELTKYGFQQTIKPPVDDMLAVHIPNMKPNRQYRDSSMGRSDFDGLRNLMDSLDETYSSWMRDIRLGKARTIVPAEYLKRPPQEMLDGLASSVSWEFDQDVETYVAIDMSDQSGNTPGITLQQFSIRSSEHAATCAELLRNIVSIAGYAPQTFGMDISGMAQSGTALHIREKKSYDTKGKKQTYWKSPLEGIMTAMVHLDAALWPEMGSDADDSVRMRFADNTANDMSTQAQTVAMMAGANAVSTEIMVEMLHPDWTQKQIAEEVSRIKGAQEESMMMQAKLRETQQEQPPQEPEEQEEPTEEESEEERNGRKTPV